MLKPGLVSVTLDQEPIDLVIQQASELGLQGIEWSGRSHLPVGCINQAFSLKQSMKEAGLQVLNYGSYVRFNEPAATQKETWCEAIQTASVLGAPCIRVWAGRSDSEQVSEKDFRRLVKNIQDFSFLARNQGLEVVIEFHRKTFTNTPDSTLKLLKAIARDHVFSLWQPHVDQPLDYQAKSLAKVLPFLKYVHCFHWGSKGSKDRLPLSEGQQAWLKYLKILMAGWPYDKDLWLALEFVKGDDLEQLSADAACLKKMLATAHGQLGSVNGY